MTQPQIQLAGYCEYLPDGSRRPCYAPATLVLVRPNGETLRFSCAEHREAWATRIRGRYLVLEKEEWVAWGREYRGPAPGGRGSREVAASNANSQIGDQRDVTEFLKLGIQYNVGSTRSLRAP